MKNFTRQVSVLALFVALFFSQVVHAASSLSFDGDGYWIDLEIGFDQEASIASVKLHLPGDPAGVVLPREFVSVPVFDTAKQVLVLHYSGDSNIPPFCLSVNGSDATLMLGDKVVSAPFRWEM